MESKAYQWKYVSADECLCQGDCELLCAYLVVSNASTDSAIYDGTDTGGQKIVDLRSAVVTGHMFAPPEPVFCRNGLYVDVGTNVTGILVQFRKLKD